MEQQSKIKTFGFFIQTYFSQILFLPLLLGGIIQIVRLFLISPQAIRFFSATQAISDGLFFLSIVFLYICSIFLTILFAMFYGFVVGDFNKPKKNKDSPNVSKEELTQYKYSHEAIPLIIHIFMFVGCLGFYYILFFRTSATWYVHEFRISTILGYGFLLVMLNFILSINIMRFIYFKREYYFKENQTAFYGLNILLCLICVFCFSVYSSDNSNFISNFKRIEEKYCCKTSGSVKILYYNDKFIFLKRDCSEEGSEIIIEKFEALFEKK